MVLGYKNYGPPGVYKVFPYGMDYDLRKTIKITE
jgi:hypothetical protein